MNRKQVIYDIERCICRVPDACRDCSKYKEGQPVVICMEELLKDALTLLKEQKARELTIDEWRKWKANPNRNPICELWENDTSPMWILNPNDVHEPALLMGKLKLFTGKPTFEQCKEVKWDGFDRKTLVLR